MKEENPITTELAKQNITEVVIADLKKKYLPLKILSIDDVEGYKKVHDARIVCRDTRVLAEKICKKGREDAIREQKSWISKEKEVVAQISEVEQHLKKQEDSIDDAKEAIKIRAERLLKLPGRKEQVTTVKEYLDHLIEENIMSFTDIQWNDIIVGAQTKKLAAQQKEIDDAKALTRMNLFADRKNALYKIAGATMQIKHGVKMFLKGEVAITEEEIVSMENDEWNIRFGEIANAQGEAPKPPELQFSVHHFDQPIVPELKTAMEKKYAEAGDEEKLFHYASALENVPTPQMKTEEGLKVLSKASELILQAINLLRQ